MFCPALVEIAVAWVKATEKNAYLSKWVASMHTLPTVTEPYIQPDSVKFYHGCIVVVCIIHTRMLTRMDVMCLTWA